MQIYNIVVLFFLFLLDSLDEKPKQPTTTKKSSLSQITSPTIQTMFTTISGNLVSRTASPRTIATSFSFTYSSSSLISFSSFSSINKLSTINNNVLTLSLSSTTLYKTALSFSPTRTPTYKSLSTTIASPIFTTLDLLDTTLKRDSQTTTKTSPIEMKSTFGCKFTISSTTNYPLTKQIAINTIISSIPTETHFTQPSITKLTCPGNDFSTKDIIVYGIKLIIKNIFSHWMLNTTSSEYLLLDKSVKNYVSFLQLFSFLFLFFWFVLENIDERKKI